MALVKNGKETRPTWYKRSALKTRTSYKLVEEEGQQEPTNASSTTWRKASLPLVNV
jgi:hypothetical protein